jgi:stage II sporulation protein AA (anti-sigma F factor antagonist)
METEAMQSKDENDLKHMDYIYMVSDDRLIVSLNAELDHHLADEMREVIDNVIDDRGVRNIIFDFSKIGFMDSAGIGLIMGRYKKIRDIGQICVVGINDSIQRILLISGLHKIVRTYEDVNQAVKSLKRGMGGRSK